MNEDKSLVVKTPFDENFCLLLEYHLSNMLSNSEEPQFKDLWCDGVQMPSVDSHLSKKSVNDTRKIITKAWIGVDGQDNYDMVIKFGKSSLRRYAKGLSLEYCIPKEQLSEWVAIDLENKVIELQLK